MSNGLWLFTIHPSSSRRRREMWQFGYRGKASCFDMQTTHAADSMPFLAALLCPGKVRQQAKTRAVQHPRSWFHRVSLLKMPSQGRSDYRQLRRVLARSEIPGKNFRQITARGKSEVHHELGINLGPIAIINRCEVIQKSIIVHCSHCECGLVR